LRKTVTVPPLLNPVPFRLIVIPAGSGNDESDICGLITCALARRNVKKRIKIGKEIMDKKRIL
jgi:hypothetical protein